MSDTERQAQEAMRSASGTIDDVANWIYNTVRNGIAEIKHALSSALSGITTTIASAFNYVKDIFYQAKSFIESVYTSMTVAR